ncbi:MAG: hypothetical protein ACLQQB_09120 [Solirubrobacteraceae bacterium]|jgi:hypothetical protein
MTGDRPRYGLLVSAFGAIVLAVAVFLPWYGVSFTAAGIAFAQQAGDQAAAQFGNATLQSYMGEYHATLSTLAGHQFTALSAHQALKDLNVVLLLLAGAAIVIALLALAGAGFSSASAPDGHRAPLLLLGILAAVCVLFRIVDPPTPEGGVLALSIREGAWLALLGSAAMVAGSLWPENLGSRSPSDAKLESAWSGFSGWTPEG